MAGSRARGSSDKARAALETSGHDHPESLAAPRREPLRTAQALWHLRINQVDNSFRLKIAHEPRLAGYCAGQDTAGLPTPRSLAAPDLVAL